MAEPQIPFQPALPPAACVAFVRNSSAAAWVKDLHGRYLILNSKAEEFFQRGRTDFDLFGPRLAEEIRRNDAQALENPDGIDVVEWLPSERGPRCVAVRKFVLPDGTGRPAFIGAMARETANLNQMVLEASSDCIMLADHAGTLLHINMAGARALNLEDRAPTGEKWWTLWSEESQPPARSAFGQAVSGQTSRFQASRSSTTGAPKYWDVTLSPLSSSDEIQPILIVSRDVTEQRLAEKRSSLLYELALAVSRAAAPLEIYQAAVRALIGGIGADRASVLIADADNVVRFKAWAGLSDEYRKTVEGHTPWQPGTAEASPITVPDVSLDASLADYFPVFQREGIAAVAFIPLMTQTGVIGKFMLYYDRPHQFSDAEIQLAETIATHVAFATERQLREAAIRESEERFRSLSACSPIGIFTTDSEGVCSYTNGSYRNICGEGTTTWFSCIEPEQRTRLATEWRAAAAAGLPFSRELPLRTPEGSQRWAHVRTNPITTPGAPLTHVGTIEDITERRHAEHEIRRLNGELRNRLNELSAILEVAPVGIAIASDPSGAIITANPYLERFAPQGAAEAVIRRALDTSQDTGPIEYQFRRPDDSTVYLLAQARPLLSADGTVRGAVASLIDISARKAAEEKLRVANAFLRTLVESSPLPILVFDTQGLITIWNPAAERVFGWTAGEVIGKPIPFIPEDKLEEHRDMRAHDLRGEGFTDREIRRKRKDGGTLDLHVSTAPLRNAAGEITAVMSLYVDVTDRRRAHDELQKVNERLILALQAGDMRAWESTIDGAAPDYDWIHPEDRRRIAQEIQEAVTSGQTWKSEYRECTDDGSTRWMMGTGKIASGGDHAAPRFIAIAVDITYRRQAEQLLRESEERMLFALDAAEMGVWELTPHTGSVHRIGELYKRFQIGSDEPSAASLDAIHPEDRPAVAHAIEVALRDASAFEQDFRMPAPDGSLHWMRGRGRLKIDPDERGLRMFGVLMDITAQKQAVLALARSEQRLQAILDYSGAAIFMKNSDGVYLMVNRLFEQLWHTTREHIIGKTDFDIAPAGAGDKYRAHDVEVLNAGQPLQFEETMPSEDGERTFIVIKFPVTDPETGSIVVCGIATEITERKRLEEKLRHAAKLESLGILAGGIAHDFNNLLTGVLGNASLLQMELAQMGTPARLAEEIISSAQRAAQLTNQMLAYAGKGRFLVERVDLKRHAREITSLLHAALPKNVQVILDLAEDTPLVEADASQLQQVIMNLVINGAEAIEHRSGAVTLRTARRTLSAPRTIGPDELPPGCYAVIAVADSGCGMPPATLARIFDPFFTTKFTGRGLGLAAVQGIVRSHHGAIAVESSPGHGTTFEVWLPAMPRDTKPAPSRSESAAPVPVAQVRALVLLVDDEEVVRRTASLMLKKVGYRVLEALDGSHALALYREHASEIGLVLLDMMMPNLSGGETLAKLRELGIQCPVVAMSGYTAEEAEREFGAGMTAFVQKPFTAQRLLMAVSRGLSVEPEPSDS